MENTVLGVGSRAITALNPTPHITYNGALTIHKHCIYTASP